MNKVLGILLDLIHLIIIFIPVLFYLIPIRFFKRSFKYIFLLLIMVPLQWGLYGDKCFLTVLSDKLGSYEDIEVKEAQFSQKYLRWLYQPILMIFGKEWNSDNVNTMAYLHWVVNFILLWYFLFFVGKGKLFK